MSSEAAPAPAPPATAKKPTGKLGALVELAKPRLNFLVLLTVAVGFWLGSRETWQPRLFAATLIGTGLVAAGASAWNQALERFRDALMRRTWRRPLPTERVSFPEAALFGTLLALTGLGLLALETNTVATAVAAATFLIYILFYTPLKSVTPLNTIVGAVPGALPPVIGWSAATGNLHVEAWALFLILFLWQFPHFLAIAWLYREDYARGGIRMLPNFDPDGAMTSRQTVVYSFLLLPAGLLPTFVRMAGWSYAVGATLVGAYYFAMALRFWAHVSDRSARRLMFASFWYLLVIVALLVIDARS